MPNALDIRPAKFVVDFATGRRVARAITEELDKKAVAQRLAVSAELPER
jgi:hypothetical protein